MTFILPMVLELDPGESLTYDWFAPLGHSVQRVSLSSSDGGGQETPFQLRARRMNSKLYQGLLPVLHRHRQDFTHSEPETAALFLLALIGGLTRDALLTGKKLTRQELYAETLVSELKRAVFGYLGASPG